MKATACKNCGAEILWLRTERYQWMPIDLEQIPAALVERTGRFEVRGGRIRYNPEADPVFISHFAVCKTRQEAPTEVEHLRRWQENRNRL